MISNVCIDYSVFYEYASFPETLLFIHTDKAVLPSWTVRYRVLISNISTI